MSGANGNGEAPLVPVARTAPADRPVGKVTVVLAATATEPLSEHTFEFVAGLQVDDVFVTLGNQDNLPIALFPIARIKAVIFLDHDKRHSDIVIPTMSAVPKRLIQ